jgi:hypothetical protein
MQQEFQELVWSVHGLIPQGLTILGGRPKSGKSFMMLQAALDVVHGRKALGQFQTERSKALYFALEDSPRRIQDRLQMLDPDGRNSADGLKDLVFAYKLPKLAAGGLAAIEDAVNQGAYKLVVIDTFGRVCAPQRGGGDTFRADYDEIAALQESAQRLGISIVLIHHTRKPVPQARVDADDPMDRILGSTGITAAADQLLVLGKVGESLALHVISRDAASNDWEVFHDLDSPAWEVKGKLSAQAVMGPQRRRIIDVLNAKGAMMPAEIAKALKRTQGSTRMLLREMYSEGQVYQMDNGKYDTTTPDAAAA